LVLLLAHHQTKMIKDITYTKENHCYPYSIENNHIHIQKEDGTVEWEIIRLTKKEFWYRDVGAENYRIYKCIKS